MIDPELKTLIDANYQLSKENNILLHKMRKAQRNAMIVKVLYWLVIAGLTIAAFYYIQPYIQKFMDSLPDFSKLGNFLPK